MSRVVVIGAGLAGLISAIRHGDQVRQTALGAWIGSTLGVARLPADEGVVL